MARIPFVAGPFPDPMLTKSRVEQRLKQHFLRLYGQTDSTDEPDSESERNNDGRIDETRADIPWKALDKIRRRAERIHARNVNRSVLGQLKAEDRKRIETLRDGLDVVAIPSEHRADEIAADLYSTFPWMSQAVEVVWHGLRRSVEEGEPGVRLPPLMLDGPPGIGKSHFARRLAKLIRLPCMTVEASNENASFGIVGIQKSWGNAAPGRLINFILSGRIANPVVILEEAEKAGSASSTKGMSFSLPEALLPLLEPLSAERWTCPYFELPFDMRWVGWVMTTNNYRLLPDPLLSRCPPIRLLGPSQDQLKAFVREMGADRNLGGASVEAICDALERAGARGQVPDLRTVTRMLDRAEWLEKRPLLH